MDLINRTNVLFFHPSYDSNRLQTMAMELTQELTYMIDGVSFADASLPQIGIIIYMCKKGLERIIKLEGSLSIVSNDSINAEQIINNTMTVLSQRLGEAMLELKTRAMTDDDKAFYTYIRELDAMTDTLLSWTERKSSAQPTNVNLIFNTED